MGRKRGARRLVFASALAVVLCGHSLVVRGDDFARRHLVLRGHAGVGVTQFSNGRDVGRATGGASGEYAWLTFLDRELGLTLEPAVYLAWPFRDDDSAASDPEAEPEVNLEVTLGFYSLGATFWRSGGHTNVPRFKLTLRGGGGATVGDGTYPYLVGGARMERVLGDQWVLGLDAEDRLYLDDERGDVVVSLVLGWLFAR